MRFIAIILAVSFLMLGCESKPQEATEVPEDLMREIAMEAARDTVKIDGPAILMMETKDQIENLARRAAAEECQRILEQNRWQMESRIRELQDQIEDLQSQVKSVLLPNSPVPGTTGSDSSKTEIINDSSKPTP